MSHLYSLMEFSLWPLCSLEPASHQQHALSYSCFCPTLLLRLTAEVKHAGTPCSPFPPFPNQLQTFTLVTYILSHLVLQTFEDVSLLKQFLTKWNDTIYVILGDFNSNTDNFSKTSASYTHELLCWLPTRSQLLSVPSLPPSLPSRPSQCQKLQGEEAWLPVFFTISSNNST